MTRLIRYLKSFLHSEYRKGFLYIFSSKILIAGVGFLTTPILSRIYTPAEYGVFGLMSAVTMVLVLLSNLSLPACLLTAKDNDVLRSATGIVEYSFLFNVIIIVTGFFLFLTIGDFDAVFGIPINPLTISLISVASFVITLTQVMANLNIRDKAFNKNVVVNLMDNISIRTASILLGILGFTKFGLFFADVIGKSVNTLQQFYYRGWNQQYYSESRFFKFSHIKDVITANKNYPLYHMPSSLISSFSNQLILWVLALSFSSSSVGYFTMSVGLLSIPLLLLANSLQPLITSKFINAKLDISYRLFLKLTTIILLLSAFIYAFIYFISPYFIGLYLGKTWLSSITFVQILCFPFALQLVGNSMGGVFIAFNKQRANFIMKLVFMILLILGLKFQLLRNSDLKLVVITYSIIVSAEELVKIIYLASRLKHVKSR